MRYNPLVMMQDALVLINEFLYTGKVINGQPFDSHLAVHGPVGKVKPLTDFLRENDNDSNIAFHVRERVRSLLHEMISRRYLPTSVDLSRVDITFHNKHSAHMYDDRRLLLNVEMQTNEVRDSIERALVELAYKGIYGRIF